MPPIDVDAILSRHDVSRGLVIYVLGVTDATFRMWRRGVRRPSPTHAILAEEKLGIPRHELRPDLWPPPARPRSQRRLREVA